MKVIYDSSYGNLPTLEKKNHSFQVWYTEKEGGNLVTS